LVGPPLVRQAARILLWRDITGGQADEETVPGILSAAMCGEGVRGSSFFRFRGQECGGEVTRGERS